MFRSITGMILSAALAGVAHAAEPATAAGMEARLAQLSDILERDYPEIVGKSDFETAIILREAIYNGVPNGLPPASPRYLYGDPVRSYEQSFYEGYPTRCGGYSQLFIFMLEARGINARRVGMWANTDEDDLLGFTQLEGHVSVEVFLDGRWIAMDPTFNVTMRDENGDGLDWRDTRTRYLLDRPVIADTDGNTSRAPLSVDSYYISFTELLENLTLGPAEPGERALNIGWDGMIHYASGDVFDYRASYMGVPDVLTARIGG